MPIRVAFIHNEQNLGTGAHFINSLISEKLKERGVIVKHFYPSAKIQDSPVHFRGLASVLFFHSLLEHKEEILSCDVIQGTTYTPLAFLSFPIPVIAHFGSTTAGFLENTPRTNKVEGDLHLIYKDLKNKGVIDSVNVLTRKPMRDIADVEKFVAQKADAVIATSLKVKDELIRQGVQEEKIHLAHNAIEDYWFAGVSEKIATETPKLVFIGRIGGNAFDLKLKGFDRLISIAESFPDLEKLWFCMTPNKKIAHWILQRIMNIRLFTNIKKHQIPEKLGDVYGDITLVVSRYEGFSLSLIEAMSRGMIPICYPCGVVPEIIVNGVNGYIVHSTEEAVKRISEVKENKKLRQTLAKGAYKTARSFVADDIAGEMVKIYRSLISDGRKPVLNKEEIRNPQLMNVS